MILVWQYILLFVIGAALVADCVKFRCDYYYTDIGWFKYHEMPTTWYDARLQCHLEGAILASPTTTQMLRYMSKISCNNEIFTGIHSILTKGQYHSVEGVPLEKIDHEWIQGEPDNKNNEESCLALHYNKKMSDERCDKPRPYVCFKPHSDIDATVCGTPDPEYRFESRTNKCYKFHTSPRTFKRANFACQAEGGYLVIINSEEEAQVIRDIWIKYPAVVMLGPFWKDVAYVGMYNWDESEDWTTIHGQWLQEAGYAKFTPGQPDNSTAGEYCGAVFRNGMFDDLWCEKHFAFICEKEPDYPPVCDSNSPRPFPVCRHNDDSLMAQRNGDYQIDQYTDI